MHFDEIFGKILDPKLTIFGSSFGAKIQGQNGTLAPEAPKFQTGRNMRNLRDESSRLEGPNRNAISGKLGGTRKQGFPPPGAVNPADPQHGRSERLRHVEF